jgi:hypothetical protein
LSSSIHTFERSLLGRLVDEFERSRCPVESEDREPAWDFSLASSCWQKAIRRGDERMAWTCARTIHRHDPAYAWRRLRGIALEDISAADLTLVAQIVAIAGKVTLRRMWGDQALLMYLSTRLARSIKCRTACDLLLWVGSEAVTVSREAEVPRVDSDVALEALHRAAVQWHSIAARSIRDGSRWRTVARANPTVRDRWFASLELDRRAAYIVQRANGADALNTLLVPVHQLGLIASAVETNEPTWAVETMSNGLPDYAYCLFSGPGRQALRRFMRATPRWVKALQCCGVHDMPRATGFLIFYLEGAHCDRHLAVSRSDEIFEASRQVTLQGFGVPPTAVAELMTQLTALRPEILNARQEIADGVS